MTELFSHISSAFNQFILVMKEFRFIDLLDILAVAFIIYSVIRFVRQTRAKQLVSGIVILLLVWCAAELLDMTALSVILKSVVDTGIIVLVILFQPELRNALALVSRTNFSFFKKDENIDTVVENCLENVCQACEMFQRSRTGALIVFERSTMLEDIVKTGTVIDSAARKELIGNLFYPNTPLHDGAVIVRDGKLYAAGCILPLSQNTLISKDLGTRHRAALGMSENSDAVIVVVSEETGTISVAEKGGMHRNYTPDELRKRLRSALLPDKQESVSRLSALRSKIKKGGKKSNEKAD